MRRTALSTPHEELEANPGGLGRCVWESLLLLLLIFAVAGSPPPSINEAHYLVKAKNFWQPEWLASDAFVASGKAHATFYLVFGWLTALMPLPAAAWVARLIGWALLAVGLQRLSWTLFRRPYASLAVAVFWMVGIEYANLAGEWVVGGIEAKVPAYGLVLLGLERMVAGRWRAVWPLLGAASAFHVLVGGWSVVAALIPRAVAARRASAGAEHASEKRGRDERLTLGELPYLAIGGVLALCGLIPALQLASGVPSVEARIATQLYVYGRLRHHLLPVAFPWEWYARHGALLVLTIAAGWLFWRGAPAVLRARTGKLFLFAGGAVLLAVAGLLLGMLPAYSPGLAARLLRFYWFRMTDAFLPLACGVALVGCLIYPPRIIARGGRQHDWLHSLVRSTAAILLVASVVVLGNQFVTSMRRDIPLAFDASQLTMGKEATLEQQRAVYEDWLAVCAWAREETPEGTLFVTPRHQQTFKWYAARPELVNWKDVPQDAASLLEWARRFNRVFPQVLGRAQPDLSHETLVGLRRDYGARYIIIDRRVAEPPQGLVRHYPILLHENKTYAVYAIPTAATEY